MLKIALTASALIVGTVLLIAVPDAHSQASTCSQARVACLRTGGTDEACRFRWRECLKTGCWFGAQVQRCGYTKK